MQKPAPAEALVPVSGGPLAPRRGSLPDGRYPDAELTLPGRASHAPARQYTAKPKSVAMQCTGLPYGREGIHRSR